MRIIHFVPYFPPERIGGVGECVANLHQAYLNAGHDSHVVTAGQTSTERVHRLDPKPFWAFLKLVHWAKFAAEADVVHCQGGEAVPLLLALALRRRRARILTTFHVSYRGIADSFRPYTVDGRRFAGGRKPWIYRHVVCTLHRVLDALTLRLSDAVNTISRASARDVLGDAKAAQAHIVYYGLHPLPNPDPRPDAPPVELFYAGLAGPRKRVHVLPFVLERVRRAVPDARLRIAGFELSEEPELEALFAEKGLRDAVECVGRKTAPELPPYYRAARCVLVPSAYEGLPFVILEAMQCGTPVVATRVSGHPEAIEDGVNGCLTDLDAPDQMADRCIALIRDSALRGRLGAAAAETIASRFNMARQVADYLALYRLLLGEEAGDG